MGLRVWDRGKSKCCRVMRWIEGLSLTRKGAYFRVVSRRERVCISGSGSKADDGIGNCTGT